MTDNKQNLTILIPVYNSNNYEDLDLSELIFIKNIFLFDYQIYIQFFKVFF